MIIIDGDHAVRTSKWGFSGNGWGLLRRVSLESCAIGTQNVDVGLNNVISTGHDAIAPSVESSLFTALRYTSRVRTMCVVYASKATPLSVP